MYSRNWQRQQFNSGNERNPRRKFCPEPMAIVATQISASCGLEYRSWFEAACDHRFPGRYECRCFHSSGSRHQRSSNTSAEHCARNRPKIAAELRLRARVCGVDAGHERQPRVSWPGHTFALENLESARDPLSAAIGFLEAALV